MNADEFRHYGKEMVDFIADYWTHLRHRSPVPKVLPGYINALVPSKAPASAEEWSTIFRDLDDVVMNGNSNWHHPHFFAYFPSGCSYQAIMADMLSGAVASIGFSWVSSPAMTELEMISLDWLVDVLGLPQYFKNSSPGPGCGIIQGSASDSTLVAIMTARGRISEMIKKSKNEYPFPTTPQLQKVIKEMRETVKSMAVEDARYGITAPVFHDPLILQRLIAYSVRESVVTFPCNMSRKGAPTTNAHSLGPTADDDNSMDQSEKSKAFGKETTELISVVVFLFFYCYV